MSTPVIIEVIRVNNPNKTHEIKLCGRCGGEGKCWTELEFGDVPGDETQYPCPRCNATGRTSIIELTVMAEVPYNFKPEDFKKE